MGCVFCCCNASKIINVGTNAINLIKRKQNIENNIVHLNRSRLGGAEDMTNGIEK